MVNVRQIGEDRAKYIAEHQEMYPEAMREDEETFALLLKSPFCRGLFVTDILAGWILFEDESVDRGGGLGPLRQAYCYDFAVLPMFQGKGYGKSLMAQALVELRWQSYRVRMHCRRTSYPILASPELLRKAAYRIVSDVFLPDHYYKEYDGAIHEDAHELIIKPIGSV